MIALLQSLFLFACESLRLLLLLVVALRQIEAIFCRQVALGVPHLAFSCLGWASSNRILLLWLDLWFSLSVPTL